MALFGKEKAPAKKTTKAAAEKETTAIATVSKETEPVAQVFGGRAVIIRPHVTEKATDLAERGNVYAFEVHNDANKAQVKLAVEKLFKVTPVKVAIVNIKSKYTKSKKNNQMVLKKKGLKKALVTLKSGDKIEFV
jgi:large subunit ribosomal protein L23